MDMDSSNLAQPLLAGLMTKRHFTFCPQPFLDLADFPYTGGQRQSRFCAPINANTTCCLPCPVTDWVYPDNFTTVANAANWVGMCSFACCALLLLSFAVLPVQKTSRHYLTVCLVAAVACLTFAFVVPLGARPQQCHDGITPNDMRSNLACAFSGAFVLFGGMAGAVWVFIRSLSLHLQICWQIVPGKKFFYASLLAGWGVPSLLLALSLILTGVSYRFGPICHINHDFSLGTFWGPILGFTGCAASCQFVTLGYCVRVYLRSLLETGTSAASSTVASSTLPSMQGSFKAMSSKVAYRRVRKVIALQWRGVMVVVILIASATYFTAVFLKLDSATVATKNDPKAALPWLECLALNAGNKDQCLGQASELILGDAVVATVLYFIASMGFWCVLFLGRWSMVGAWRDLICRPFTRDGDNWISADARRTSDPRNYEMLTAPPQQYYMAKGPSGLVATATTQPAEKSLQLTSFTVHEQPRALAQETAPSTFEKRLMAEQTVQSDRLSPQFNAPAQRRPGTAERKPHVSFVHESKTTPSTMTPYGASSPDSLPGHENYFSRPLPNPRHERKREQSDAMQSNTGSHTAWTHGRQWYGREDDTAQSFAGRGSAQSGSRDTSREWDPQSTFAKGNGMAPMSR